MLLIFADPVRPDHSMTRYLFQVKRILIGTRLHMKQVLTFIFVVQLGVLLAADVVGYTADKLTIAYVESIVGGLVFALNFGYLERNPGLGKLIQIARYRCLAMSGQDILADYQFIELVRWLQPEIGRRYVTRSVDYPETVAYLARAINFAVIHSGEPDEAPGTGGHRWLYRHG